MNTRAVFMLMKKDLKEVLQNKGAVLPTIIIPLVFMVLFPLAIILIPTQIPTVRDSIASGGGDFEQIMSYIGSFLGDQIAGLNNIESWIVVTTGYLLAPFVLIMPLMVSTIIGAESFVGEKERKTMEALIYTPLTDSELFSGKVLASVIPAVLLTWLSFLLYGITVNLASWPVMRAIWFPPMTWWPLMFWLAPAIAMLGMAASVLISVRASTFMDAYQMSGSLVILVLALVLGQISGVLFLSVAVTLLLGLAVWMVDFILIWFGIKIFARASLLARL